MTITADRRFALLGALLLTLVLGFSGIDKLLHYEGFVNAVRSYAVVPRGMAPWITAPVIGLEILLAFLLILPSSRGSAAAASAVLLGCFTAAVGIDMIFQGRELCGCWFSVTTAGGGWHLAQNILLILLALVVHNDCRHAPTSRAVEPNPQAISVAVRKEIRP